MSGRADRAGKRAARLEEPESLARPAPTAERPVCVVRGTHAEPTQILPHLHPDETQFLVPLEGVVRIETDATLWMVPPGKAILVPAGLRHGMAAPSGTVLCAVLIHATAFPMTGEDCRLVAANRLLMALVEAVAAVPADYPPDGPDGRLVRVLIDQLTSAEAEPFHLRRPRDGRLRLIFDGLAAEPGNPMTLAQWGRRVGASQRTLARLFETETGMGFRDFRRLIQMHAAVGLIGAGRSVTDVAAELGYESTSAFIHAFRTVIGTTPGRLQRDRQAAKG